METSRIRRGYLIAAVMIAGGLSAALLVTARLTSTTAHAHSKLARLSAKKQPINPSAKVVAQSAIEAAGRAIQEAQAALDRALSEEKANPTPGTHKAADEAAIALQNLGAEVVKSLNERRGEIEVSVRQLIQALNIDPAQVETDPATRDLMAEMNAAIDLIKSLSWSNPKPELEPNDDAARSDRILMSGEVFGARTGSVERGDADFYSIESKDGYLLRFDLTIVSGKKGRTVTAELLAPNTLASLLTFDSGSANGGKAPEYTISGGGKYYLKITAKKKTDYQLAVHQIESQLQAAATLCTTFNFETGAQGFTVVPVVSTPLWHLATTCRAELPGHSTPTTFYYGQECQLPCGTAPVDTCAATCNYNTCDRNASNLVSPAIPVGGTTTLTFNYLLFVESSGGFDTAFVDVSTDGGTTFTQVLSKASLINDNNWHSAAVGLSPFVGSASSVRVRFRFDSVDNIVNSSTGWHVDDVAVCSTAANACPPTSSLLCLQDETNAGNFVVFDFSTGAYQFFCNGALIASGTGTPTVKACLGTIDDAKGDRRVHIEWDLTAVGGKGAGTAILQLGPNNTKCQVTDKDMSNNTCTVPAT